MLSFNDELRAKTSLSEWVCLLRLQLKHTSLATCKSEYFVIHPCNIYCSDITVLFLEPSSKSLGAFRVNFAKLMSRVSRF